jgi:hypothetical protein
MRRALIWLLLCFGCLFDCCAGTAAAEPSNGSETGTLSEATRYEAYADKVIAVDRNHENVGAKVYGYLGMQVFEKLADASTESPELCVRFLSEKKYTEHQRFLAILSMYKLSIEQYVAFVGDLAALRDRGLISPEELMRGVLPRLSMKMVFEHYQDKGIQALFKEMAAQEDIPPDIKATIRYIRSGEGFARMRRNDFDRECMRWSEMRSIAACVSLATQILRVYAVSWMTW